MSLIALDLNDAGITALDAGKVLYREPGFALLDDGRLTTGNAAFAEFRISPRSIQNRFWRELTTEPLPDRRFSHLSAADLVSRQLEELWQGIADRGDRVVAAVPPYMSNEQLALFLGIGRELGVPVIALVDEAVAATRRHYRGAVPVHVDLSLHGALLTRIAQDDQARVDRAVVVDDAGMLALFDAWVRVIAAAFIRHSRFDPLHTAATEQALLDRMPEWMTRANTEEQLLLDIEYRGIRHEAELEALDLVSAAAPVYHAIVSKLRALIRADETAALQLSDRAATLPGLADMLRARVGGEVFVLEPGAAARGLLARCRDMRPGEGGVTLIRQLPWDQSAVLVEIAAAARESGLPTHLLLDDTAYAIDDKPLSVGTVPGGDERWVNLEGEMPGVSRRHCSLVRENGQCVLKDYSRYGTFLNGHRIDGSAVLQVGDRIRVGTPGFEFRLITTETGHGA